MSIADINLADMVEVLLHYDVRHIKDFPGNESLAGTCDTVKRLISLDDDFRLHDRRDTLVHEMIHGYSSLQTGKELTEVEVRRLTKETMKRLYGL